VDGATEQYLFEHGIEQMKDKAAKERLINEAIAAVDGRWDELETQAFHVFIAQARRELSAGKTKLTEKANANSIAH
jgi:hypothetical protein